MLWCSGSTMTPQYITISLQRHCLTATKLDFGLHVIEGSRLHIIYINVINNSNIVCLRPHVTYKSWGSLVLYRTVKTFRDWGQPLVTQLSPVTANFKNPGLPWLETALGDQAIPSRGKLWKPRSTVIGDDSPWSPGCPQSLFRYDGTSSIHFEKRFS